MFEVHLRSCIDFYAFCRQDDGEIMHYLLQVQISNSRKQVMQQNCILGEVCRQWWAHNTVLVEFYSMVVDMEKTLLLL